MKIEITPKGTHPLQFHTRALITPEAGESNITLDATQSLENAQVRISGPAKVIVAAGLELNSLHAPEADVVIQDGAKTLSLTAKSLIAEGSLYVPFTFKVSGDATIAGALNGERHDSYEVGGDLKAEGIDIDGHLSVGGDLTANWIETRSHSCGGTETIGEPDADRLTI